MKLQLNAATIAWSAVSKYDYNIKIKIKTKVPC